MAQAFQFETGSAGGAAMPAPACFSEFSSESFSAFCNADPWAAQLAASLGADEATLAEFKHLMQAHALPLDTGRLFMDADYAYQRFALTHSRADEPLRRLAMQLFEGYQRLEARRKNLCLGMPVH